MFLLIIYEQNQTTHKYENKKKVLKKFDEIRAIKNFWFGVDDKCLKVSLKLIFAPFHNKNRFLSFPDTGASVQRS